MQKYMKTCEDASGEQSPEAGLGLNSALQIYWIIEKLLRGGATAQELCLIWMFLLKFHLYSG